jgi:hypothetical protein
VNVVPLSSSPEPVNVTADAIPIGLPVTSFEFEEYVATALPVAFKAPACADATVARDPHNADNPTLVSLFIIIYISY